MNAFDHVLFIGFGGPRSRQEVWPFIQEVAQGRGIPEERLRVVERHYEMIGGVSPYPRQAVNLLEAVRAHASRRGISIPIFLGMRCWHPFLREVVGDIRRRGLKRGLAVVLAPHRAEASFGRSQAALEQVTRQAAAGSLTYTYAGPWHDHPLFIEAQADRVRSLLGQIEPARRLGTQLVFTAHSIPVAMAQGCRYEEEFQVSSARVAEALGISKWECGYQSRSGSGRQPWLGPDLLEVIAALPSRGKQGVAVVPIGFLFDHTEVLYDLDIEAKAAAGRAGLAFWRASTVMDHPRFVEMLVALFSGESGGLTHGD